MPTKLTKDQLSILARYTDDFLKQEMPPGYTIHRSGDKPILPRFYLEPHSVHSMGSVKMNVDIENDEQPVMCTWPSSCWTAGQAASQLVQIERIVKLAVLVTDYIRVKRNELFRTVS
jgi:hypothetical protein